MVLRAPHTESPGPSSFPFDLLPCTVVTPRARVVGLRVLQFSSVRQLGYSTVSSYCKLYCNWCSDTARHDSARRGCFRCEGSNDHIPPTEFHTVIYTARTRLGESDVVSRQMWTTGYSTASTLTKRRIISATRVQFRMFLYLRHVPFFRPQDKTRNKCLI